MKFPSFNFWLLYKISANSHHF